MEQLRSHSGNGQGGVRIFPVLRFFAIALLLALVITKLVSVIVALVAVPIVFDTLSGFESNLGEIALNGVMGVASTVVRLTYAIHQPISLSCTTAT